MKKVDAEFLRNYYSFFTLDYEKAHEENFMYRVILIGSGLLHICTFLVIAYLLFVR